VRRLTAGALVEVDADAAFVVFASGAASIPIGLFFRSGLGGLCNAAVGGR
jgi:hypothetical protein